jgi:hypothetical protein
VTVEKFALRVEKTREQLTMNRDEIEPRTGSEPEHNPYAPPRAPLMPEGSRLGPATSISVNVRGAISVAHSLTDDDLRRFVGCDAFYDAMPLFGFIPQWVWFLTIMAPLWFLLSMVQTRSLRVSLVSAPALCGVLLAIMVLMARSRRNAARLAGLCEKRTMTITPNGLSLTIPGVHAVSKELTTIGPLAHRRSDTRKVEARKGYALLWLHGRLRLVLPLGAFPSPAEADAFLESAKRWHTNAA